MRKCTFIFLFFILLFVKMNAQKGYYEKSHDLLNAYYPVSFVQIDKKFDLYHSSSKFKDTKVFKLILENYKTHPWGMRDSITRKTIYLKKNENVLNQLSEEKNWFTVKNCSASCIPLFWNPLYFDNIKIVEKDNGQKNNKYLTHIDAILFNGNYALVSTGYINNSAKVKTFELINGQWIFQQGYLQNLKGRE